MRAKLLKGKYWRCDSCDVIKEEESSYVTTLYVNDSDYQVNTPRSNYLDRLYFTVDCGSEEWVYCGDCGEYLMEESEFSYDTGWECSKCSAIYLSKGEADECCQ